MGSPAGIQVETTFGLLWAAIWRRPSDNWTGRPGHPPHASRARPVVRNLTVNMRRTCVALVCVACALLPAAASSREARFTAYLTGYGHHDNTPAGGRISDARMHLVAGGRGTYQDPITLAVGHSILNGRDKLDIAAGTRFYVPNLRKYFIVEDTCGDGDAPQNGPCHTGFEGRVWLDLWVGGGSATPDELASCEAAITGTRLVIQDPDANYAVTEGPILDSTCAAQYGDAVVNDAKNTDRNAAGLETEDARAQR